MHHSQIWEDISTGVDAALANGLHLLDENDLIDRADRLFANVPTAGGTQPTTALLLRKYHAQLHAELCTGSRPRAHFETLDDELRELTRAVVVAVDSSEGTSIETSVLLGLIIYQRGLAHFCARPATAANFS